MIDRSGRLRGAEASPSKKINDAVQRGLAKCRQSVAPIVTLAEFVDDLRGLPGWTEYEVHQAEMALRHLLSRIVDKPR
jgi:hypothetical protein